MSSSGGMYFVGSDFALLKLQMRMCPMRDGYAIWVTQYACRIMHSTMLLHNTASLRMAGTYYHRQELQ
jgi:hypothetical protein